MSTISKEINSGLAMAAGIDLLYHLERLFAEIATPKSDEDYCFKQGPAFFTHRGPEETDRIMLGIKENGGRDIHLPFLGKFMVEVHFMKFNFFT